nr:MAG: ORF1 [TTV-like mini virus]
MPYFQRYWIRRKPRTNYYTRRYNYRRRLPWRRRSTKTFRRTFRRRTNYNRVRRYKKTYKKNRRFKKKKIPLYQYQPKKIVNCKVKGIFLLLYCSKGRESFNFAQYQESFVPVQEPGGGGWGLFVFSLGALYQEHQKLKNIWTKSNTPYDLVRYRGVKFKFYRQQHVDYVVKYSLCYPMVDTLYTHAACHPQRLLISNQKIIVRSRNSTKSKRSYVKKFIRPPQLMVNKWFFQKEICNTPLVLLTASSTTLDNTFINTNSQSTNIELYCLNPKVFQAANWQKGTGNNYQANKTFYYWGHPTALPQNPPNTAIPLTATENRPGQITSNTQHISGNLLYHKYLHNEMSVYVTQTQTYNKDSASALSQSLLTKCRYNPQRDTGLGNEAYIIPNASSETFNPSTDNTLKIDGFPLWLMLWGLTDWWRKSKPASQIDLNYTFVFKSPFVTPILDYYCVIDQSFIDGKGPYNTDPTLISDSNNKHWYPRIRYQNETINIIATSGPSAPKPLQKSWEAKCEYEFFFKWGGCPPKSQDVDDPCEKPTYPIPDKVSLGPQIEDPATEPKTKLFPWDFRRDTVTKRAIKRIQENTDIKNTLLELTETPPKWRRMDPDPYQTTENEEIWQTLQQASPPEKIQTEAQQLLQHFKQQQHLLRNRLKFLTQLQEQKLKKLL